MKRWIPTLAVVPFLVAASAVIAPRPFVRDVPHSQINFVAESQLVDAHGTFDTWDAEILFDAEKAEASSVVITIDAKSINTRITQRTHIPAALVDLEQRDAEQEDRTRDDRDDADRPMKAIDHTKGRRGLDGDSAPQLFRRANRSVQTTGSDRFEQCLRGSVLLGIADDRPRSVLRPIEARAHWHQKHWCLCCQEDRKRARVDWRRRRNW